LASLNTYLISRILSLVDTKFEISHQINAYHNKLIEFSNLKSEIMQFHQYFMGSVCASTFALGLILQKLWALIYAPNSINFDELGT
jgi:hypothetical protein